MARQRVTHQGFTATKQYLTVYFTIGEQGTKRVHEVKVPMADLPHDKGFVQSFGDATAAALRGAWDLDEPMILLGGDEFSTVPW